MKKISWKVLLVTLLMLCGCSALRGSSEDGPPQFGEENGRDAPSRSDEESDAGDYGRFFDFSSTDVETLKSWSFQFNEESNDYSLFFALLNADEEYISANVDVDIQIVSENGEEVYRGTKSVYKDDFDYYTSQAEGRQYLANVRIPASDILPGTSLSGKVFFTVYKDDIIRFEEADCDASYCLPIKDVELTCDSLPLELELKDYYGDTESILQINDVTYTFEKDYLPKLKITILGEKIYGNTSSGCDAISYKLYDSEGYMVDASDVFLSSLSKGDKFKDNSIVIYDIEPGTSYTLKLMARDW